MRFVEPLLGWLPSVVDVMMAPAMGVSQTGRKSVYLLMLFVSGACQSVADSVALSRVLLSEEGSGRATAYIESPKVLTFEGKTHAAWLDSPGDGFRVRIRTLDHRSGQWSEPFTIGEASNNHGGPALTVDGDGYLHVLYYAHHEPLRYRRSLRPNDASEWTPFEEFGQRLTYPALLCARDGSLITVARRRYSNQPWELELWRKAPEEPWESRGPIVRSRYGGYAQFAASLAWGPDHETLHIGTRIYELPINDREEALTTVGYMVSPDSGETWTHADGTGVELPATADSIDVIAIGRGSESRRLHAGSIAVDASGQPHVPYGVRTQESSQSYLATPLPQGKWHQLHLNPFLPDSFREWDLYMHGGIAFGTSGQPTLVATIMEVPLGADEFGEPTTELVRFESSDGGESFTSHVLDVPDADTPRWMPNIERPTGFNHIPEHPGFIYTDGDKGDSLDEQLSNRVWWVPGAEISL